MRQEVVDIDILTATKKSETNIKWPIRITSWTPQEQGSETSSIHGYACKRNSIRLALVEWTSMLNLMKNVSLIK